MMTDVFLEEGIIHFSSKLSTGIDLAITFDEMRCITKNIYPNYNGKMERGIFYKKLKYISKMYFIVYSRETAAFLRHSHKITQYMYQPES